MADGDRRIAARKGKIGTLGSESEIGSEERGSGTRVLVVEIEDEDEI